MERQDRIAGGIFVFVLMFLTAAPFNDEIQGLALASGASTMIIGFSVVFPVLWVGLTFIVLAFTGYEVLRSF